MVFAIQLKHTNHYLPTVFVNIVYTASYVFLYTYVYDLLRNRGSRGRNRMVVGLHRKYIRSFLSILLHFTYSIRNLGFVVLNLQKSMDFSLPGVQNAFPFVRSFKKLMINSRRCHCNIRGWLCNKMSPTYQL
jgi:hypothetical protein